MIIVPKRLSGEIYAPPSKSMAHRAVICAALADGESVISNVEMSDDIKATIKAVCALGAEVEITKSGRRNALHISGISHEKKCGYAEIDCNESGSTLRFMIPIALALAEQARFIGEGRLPERPIDTYRVLFESRGIKWSQGNSSLPLELSGELNSGIYELPGNISSQYITGLLFSLPLLKGDSEIIITGDFESRRYVDMTLQMLSQFKIVVQKTENGFRIAGGQKYMPSDYSVEGDWSQAAFLIAMGVLGSGTQIKGLRHDSLQGDKAIVDILKSMEADITWRGDTLVANGSKLSATTADVSQCPDLAPAIACAMSVAHGTSRIVGGQRLKIKETDRIMSVTGNLNGLGANITPTDDGMIIEGVKSLAGGIADGTGDHRISMMVAAASSMCENEIELSGESSVNKSYPSFWEDFVLLGGKIK